MCTCTPGSAWIDTGCPVHRNLQLPQGAVLRSVSLQLGFNMLDFPILYKGSASYVDSPDGETKRLNFHAHSWLDMRAYLDKLVTLGEIPVDLAVSAEPPFKELPR